MALTIKELLASDTISQAADKINFNFDQLLLNGGGPSGPAGPQGPPGPIGGRGVRGSQWFEDPTPQPGADPNTFIVSPDLEPNDSYLQANGNVWEYIDEITGWVNTGIDLTGPQGPAAFQYWAETGQPPISGQELLYPTTFIGSTGPTIRTTYLGAVPSQVPSEPQYKISTNINTQTNISNTVLGLQVPGDAVAAIRFIGADPNQDDLYTQDISTTQSIQLYSGDLLRLVDVKVPTNATELIGHNFSSSHKSLVMQYGRGVTIQSGLSTDSTLLSDTSILLQVDADAKGGSTIGRIVLDNLAAGHTAYLNVGDDNSTTTLSNLPVMTGYINLKAKQIYNYAEDFIWNTVNLGNIQNQVNTGGIFSEATTKIQEKVGTGTYEVISNDTEINAFQDISIDSDRYTTMENQNLIIKNNQGIANNYTWIRSGGGANSSHGTVFISNLVDTIPTGMYPTNDGVVGQRPTLTVSGGNPSGNSSSATIAVGEYAYNKDSWIAQRGRGAIYAQNNIVVSNDTELTGYYGIVASSRLYLDNAEGDSTGGAYGANEMIVSNNRRVVPGKSINEAALLNIFTDSTNNDGLAWGKNGFTAVDINFSEIDNTDSGSYATSLERSLLNLQYSDAVGNAWRSSTGGLYGVNVNFGNVSLRNIDAHRVYAFKSKLELAPTSNGDPRPITRSFGLHIENVGGSYSASASSNYESLISRVSENSNWLQRGLQVGLKLGEQWQANEKCNAITNMNPVRQEAGTENIYLTLMPMARSSQSRAGQNTSGLDSKVVLSSLDPPADNYEGVAPGLMFQGLQSRGAGRYNPAENSFGAQTSDGADNPNRTLALIYSDGMTPSGPVGRNGENSNFSIFPHAGGTGVPNNEVVATTFNYRGQVRMHTAVSTNSSGQPRNGENYWPRTSSGGVPGGGGGQVLSIQQTVNPWPYTDMARSYAQGIWNPHGYGLLVRAGGIAGVSATIIKGQSDEDGINGWTLYKSTSGSVLESFTSDERLKTNIKDINPSLGLESINKIKVREFSWIGKENHTNVGVIAQEVLKVYPKLVYLEDDIEDEDGTITPGRYSVSYSGFISPLIKATQELSAKCDKLEKENKELSDRLKLIEEKLGL